MRRSLRFFSITSPIVRPAISGLTRFNPQTFDHLLGLQQNAYKFMQPGQADTARAYVLLCQAMELSVEIRNNTASSELSVENRKILSAVYLQYAQLLYSSQSIQKVFSDIQSLLEESISLDPDNKQAQNLKLAIDCSWELTPPR
jgi:hypothetical protein